MGQRIDVLLVSRGLAASRQRAQRLIENGSVTVNGKLVTKASASFDDEDVIKVLGQDIPFVSRGGLKLQKAFETFEISVSGMVCADIGASTGGFTDCLLQHGAAFVYAVDSGHDQLHASLKERPDVCNMEGINARNMTPELFGKNIEFLTMDVSFISITKILPVLCGISTDYACAVCLIKPQFEAGREFVGKKGVVRDKKVHLRIINEITAFSRSLGFGIAGLTWSPIRGPEGNIEYLMYLKKHTAEDISDMTIRQTVEAAFSAL